MTDFRNRTALVTGASSGIGAAFAEALAARGADLVLAAPSEEKLRPVGERLRALHGVRVWTVPVDLAREDGPDLLVEQVRATGREIDVLVNNAGFGTYGRYEELPADRDHREVMVDVVAVERVTHLLLPAMVERGRGTVVNVSSTSGFQAVPYMAVYGASKAFVLSFSIALWAEYRSRGIRVLAVCPGPTDTNFFEVLGRRMSAGGRLRTTDEVVSAAFRGLDRGLPYVIDGRLNYLTSNASRLLGRGLVAGITARTLRPRGHG
ncbi:MULTISPECIES: SDR family oxidoreductase [unclassified Parafrankia]|uniref:SDR family NAD(P)-dependent oxidoreductase n=1 Tax=unclassified Parafrankia TaxID=2994368 RepID=UPI000DA4B440|nr:MULTISPECIES: SDR family oxidoreductase [unclassified Parafrankia]TCJ38563.1 SDR family oxidoreductase [Parafrankia sp. BMG5.11]SQD95270.1 Short-chain dehydrogenase/reductase SDR [Parafrankia sp. Ea1.12]